MRGTAQIALSTLLVQIAAAARKAIMEARHIRTLTETDTHMVRARWSHDNVHT